MNSDLDSIFPLIVPANYTDGSAWDLPHYKLPNPLFLLTWVFFDSPGGMTYITRSDYDTLNSRYPDWQQRSFENLRQSIGDNENFFTHCRLSTDGQRLVFISFMNADGIGSSRILLSHELTKAFPQGYYLAFPDRSCGLAIAKDITPQELDATGQLVNTMFKGATTNMSPQLHAPGDFALPQPWTHPIDEAYSDILVNEVFKLRNMKSA